LRSLYNLYLYIDILSVFRTLYVLMSLAVELPLAVPIA
jgi:hypothetical protein